MVLAELHVVLINKMFGEVFGNKATRLGRSITCVYESGLYQMKKEREHFPAAQPFPQGHFHTNPANGRAGEGTLGWAQI